MKRRALSVLVAVTAACALLFLQGCATSGRLKAVSVEATARAEIPGMAGVMSLAIHVIVDLEFPRLGLIHVGDADQVLVELRNSMQ